MTEGAKHTSKRAESKILNFMVFVLLVVLELRMGSIIDDRLSTFVTVGKRKFDSPCSLTFPCTSGRA